MSAAAPASLTAGGSFSCVEITCPIRIAADLGNELQASHYTNTIDFVMAYNTRFICSIHNASLNDRNLVCKSKRHT